MSVSSVDCDLKSTAAGHNWPGPVRDRMGLSRPVSIVLALAFITLNNAPGTHRLPVVLREKYACPPIGTVKWSLACGEVHWRVCTLQLLCFLLGCSGDYRLNQIVFRLLVYLYVLCVMFSLFNACGHG